jgi:acetolactate decarboxylase
MAIDPELIRALHLVPEDRHGAQTHAAAPHHLFQTSTIAALMDARYDGDLTVGEVLRRGDLGLGTLAGLDGELIIVDGVAHVGRVDGSLSPVDSATTTPFAVVTPFAPGAPVPLRDLAHDALLAEIDRRAQAPVSAIKVEGTFRRLRLRSVPRQHTPYPPLDEVVRQQAEWEAGAVDAVLVGFRFPAEAAGLEVPGWHLHAMTCDGSTGGHVLIADLAEGTAWLDAAVEVHVELPAGVELTAADAIMREGIMRAETHAATD